MALGHLTVVKKRLEELYQRIEKKGFDSFSTYARFFELYLDKVAQLEMTDAHLQQRLLWSRRLHARIDTKEKYLLEEMIQERVALSKKCEEQSKFLYGVFKNKLIEKLKACPHLSYVPRNDVIRYTFSDDLPPDVVQRLLSAFKENKHPFLLEDKKTLVLKRVSEIRLDKIEGVLVSFDEFIRVAQESLQQKLER